MGRTVCPCPSSKARALALKGGAAINLFLRNLPRLSGDLDSFLGCYATIRTPRVRQLKVPVFRDNLQASLF
ncbi:MAG: nucleotidyl transferase AbiEii/AbiGii toxin family protein [Vulcanimicrobiota bacterium]